MTEKKIKKTMTEKKPHSIEYMGEARNFWWNDDYLKLLAKRLNLAKKSVMVDVGCGYGLMGLLLSKFMKKNATIYGFDLEKEHIAKAKKLAAADHSGKKFSFEVADAYELPLENNFSDITVCQTLLIHLNDPQRAIKEMIRVTKPGGLIVAFEPNNMASVLYIDQFSDLDLSVEEKLEETEMVLRHEKGKMALGEGFDSLGDVVPELFLKSGLKEVALWLSEKCLSIIPPYGDSPEMSARVAQVKTFMDEDLSGHSYDKYLKYYLAGGGSKEKFDKYWKRHLVKTQQVAERLNNGSYIYAGGNIFYIVVGKK
jgi:SAM-dependent methyltransferase